MTVDIAQPLSRGLSPEEEEEEEEEEAVYFIGGVYSYSVDTVGGPRAPILKLTAHHSSLTRVRAANKE